MNCVYCNKEKYHCMNWEGLKGYPIGKKCLKLKDKEKLETFFMKNKLKGVK